MIRIRHAGQMGAWQLLLVGLVMLLGLVGVFIPGVPGRWLVWAAMLWWSMHVRTGLAWVLLVASTAVLLVDQVVVWLLPPRRIRGMGITRRMVVSAGVGAVVGFFLLPVVGAVPGFIGGIYGSERRRLGGHGQAVASTRAVMRAVGTSVLVELFACLLVVGAWLGAVFWG
jgi:uncharacterized protein YqgC (DUF456 family)